MTQEGIRGIDHVVSVDISVQPDDAVGFSAAPQSRRCVARDAVTRQSGQPGQTGITVGSEAIGRGSRFTEKDRRRCHIHHDCQQEVGADISRTVFHLQLEIVHAFGEWTERRRGDRVRRQECAAVVDEHIPTAFRSIVDPVPQIGWEDMQECVGIACACGEYRGCIVGDVIYIAAAGIAHCDQVEIRRVRRVGVDLELTDRRNQTEVAGLVFHHGVNGIDTIVERLDGDFPDPAAVGGIPVAFIRAGNDLAHKLRLARPIDHIQSHKRVGFCRSPEGRIVDPRHIVVTECAGITVRQHVGQG